MITNATLNTITSPPTVNAAGKKFYGAATAAGVRCAMSEVDEKLRLLVGASIKDATALLDVLKAPLIRLGITPANDMKVSATIDGDGAKSYTILHVGNRQKSGGLAHFRIFLVEVSA